MVTVWELKALCEQNIKDESLSIQHRNAWENALKSVEVNLKESVHDKQQDSLQIDEEIFTISAIQTDAPGETL